MARPATIEDEMVEAARKIVQQAQTARQLRRGLSIVLPSALGASNATTAKVLGIGSATVVRMQREIRDQVAGSPHQKGKWGGRRRQLLTIEEEEQFLEPWTKEAESGGVLVVPPIHEALEKRLGRTMPASTVYRMLARHGWRKVTPDTCHPNRDKQAQQDFKKNSTRYWIKLPL
jgi:transposase